MDMTGMPENTPPMMADSLPPKPTTWPTGIGITSIILGSLGMVCYGCNSISTMLQPVFMNMVPEAQRAEMPPPIQGAMLYVVIFQYCASTALAVWLLFAGIGIVRRRPWGATHHVAWAVAKLLLSIVMTAAAFVMAPDFIQMLNDQFKQLNITVGMTGYIVMQAVTLVIVLAWPAFVLLWFARAPIKDEVAQWSGIDRAVI